MDSWMERLLIASMLLLAIIPFNQVFLLKLGFITLGAYELMYIFILLLSTIIILLRGVRRGGLWIMALWLSLSFFYFLLSPIMNDVSLSDAFRQLRFFVPFFVATILLATPISGNLEKILQNVVYATGLGALIAVVIHLAFPGFLESALSANEEAALIAVEHGRLYWGNALLCFIVFAHFMATKNRSPQLYLSIFVSILALLLTLNRTMIVLLPVFYLVANIYLTRSIVRPVFALGMFVAISTILIVAFADERFYNLFVLRFLGQGDFGSVYENAVLINRIFLYDQYFQIFIETFPIGQGLGLPLSSGINDVFSTDISALSFVLPFGLFGLAVLSIFIIKVWRASNTPSWGIGNNEKLAITFRIMLLMLLLASLNIDVFSRDNAVVFIAFVASLLLGRRDAQHAISSSARCPRC